MWGALASLGAIILKYFLFGWLSSYLSKRSGKKEAELEGRLSLAEQEKKQHQALVDGSSAVADADDFADRVRDSGF